ncbi:ATP-binding cassette domain-containing protein [Alkalibaculum sp. M08DMB]|uniref:ATP-binding cassette domain-containing protein n=1 Tax=Alkalibaculum sporogenes TaxID=2655001 RepID=A0A6A7K6E3_9FIRM|nr:ABC transporter ATP-binding protein [Alkalibaculum sporogenes]MPW24944.1 ATP-binding cassette domain-containing protein [Alkalibaculum sporogenes]
MGKEFILDIEDVNVSYKDKNVIEEINLQIPKGKIVAVVGPNGCGKTTLIRTISRSIKPNKGKILLNGENIFKMKIKYLARKMAVLSQNNTNSNDVTVKNLVQYGRFSHKSWWKGSEIEDSKIINWAIKMTKLDALSHRKINTLSGGERQRAWIAMALAQKPEILLLDEPTTYLDIAHQLEILELISKLNKEEGITILMVLHDINHAVRFSDELIVLKDRRVVRQGDPWMIIESEVLQEVFHVEAEIIMDRENHRPIFYATKVQNEHKGDEK